MLKTVVGKWQLAIGQYGVGILAFLGAFSALNPKNVGDSRELTFPKCR
jgi:hypothetical protein